MHDFHVSPFAKQPSFVRNKIAKVNYKAKESLVERFAAVAGIFAICCLLLLLLLVLATLSLLQYVFCNFFLFCV